MEELGKKQKNVEEENVGTISTAISTNSTFHKNVVTFLKNVGRILKKRKVVSNIFKMLTKIS
jgi:urease gamma subunit